MRIIGGIKGSQRIKSSKSRNLRPTMDRVRETVFNILGERIVDSRFLDLFAGTGSVGIEALSRGAKHVFFIEKDNKAAKILRENLNSLGFERVNRILIMDFTKAVKFMKNSCEEFDVIYVDAPYASGFSAVSLRLLSDFDILKQNGLILAEHFHKNKMEERFGNLKLFRVKKIGDTCISFFKKAV